jgi:hypothetical protein
MPAAKGDFARGPAQGIQAMRMSGETMAPRRRWKLLAAALCAANLLLLDLPVQGREGAPPPFGPPLQYVSKPGQEFTALLTANVAWLKSKLTDRKRRRREAQNTFRLEPAATKPQVQEVIDQLDKEISETQAALIVANARVPADAAAQKQLVKANVEAWIKALNKRAEDYRGYAEEAEQKAKKAGRQLDATRYRLDMEEDNQIADKAEKEAKALADDLRTAGL